MSTIQHLTAECQCGETHEVTYSHDGRFNEGPIYALVCPADHLTSYVTTEIVNGLPAPRAATYRASKADVPVTFLTWADATGTPGLDGVFATIRWTDGTIAVVEASRIVFGDPSLADDWATLEDFCSANPHLDI